MGERGGLQDAPSAYNMLPPAMATQDSSIHYSELRMCLSGKSKKNNTVQQ